MKVILLDSISELGDVGSLVTVKPGYARNFLIPQSKAVLGTKSNIELFKKNYNDLQKKIPEKKIQAQSYADMINQLGKIFIEVLSGVEGKLFGSVGPKDIADMITKQSGIKISKSQVRLPNNLVLKNIGTYKVSIHIYHGIYAYLDVVVCNERK